jgi:regulator of sirC expression with transglutaminase-like and TPR domain
LLAVLDRLVILLPQDWDWRRERGLTHAELGRTPEAIEDLSAYLDHAATSADHDRVAARLQALREAGPTRWH